MKKAKILELLPKRDELKKSLKANRKTLGALSNEVIDLEAALEALDGVTLYEGYPVRVVDTGDSTSGVYPAPEENGRSADLECEDSKGWSVTGFRNDDNDGIDLGSFDKRAAAEKAAKHFVATGKNLNAPKPVRGRPRKDAAIAV